MFRRNAKTWAVVLGGVMLAASTAAMAQGLISAKSQLAAASKASTVVLSTPLLVTGGTSRIHCTIVNVSSQSITTTTRIVSETGTVLLQVPPILRAPGTGGSNSEAPIGAAYRCEFTFTGTPSDVRGSIQLTNSSGEILGSADAH